MPDEQVKPPFQFSLATLLIVMTGVCVALSLSLWHTTYGLMAAILLVGGGWSLAAVRAEHRRLAYTLAACALGVLTHWVLAVPFGIFMLVSRGPSQMVAEEMGIWFWPPLLMTTVLATLLAAMIMRKDIRRPSPTIAFRTPLTAVYLTAVLFPVILGVPLAVIGMFLAGIGAEGVMVVLLGSLLSPVVATLTLPVTLPTAMQFCALLRTIDPLQPEAIEPDSVCPDCNDSA